jgi:hypothetical protein
MRLDGVKEETVVPVLAENNTGRPDPSYSYYWLLLLSL